MKSIYKGVLSLFIGTIIICCAGTDSSAQKKGHDNSSLFKTGTPTADSLVSSMPEFAHSVFKKAIDSVPGDYYYHVTGGWIDTLFKKESGQYKPIVSIVYDLLDEQNNFEIKKESYSYLVEDGVLTAEVDFPKYYKTYWHNRKTKQIAIGILYRDDQGSIHLDSGHSETYFENGKIYQQNDWKDKQIVVTKEWNENGILTKDIDFPKYAKEYWDNGKPMNILTGVLYKDDQGVIRVDSGHWEAYFENGKISEKSDWKDKQIVATKEWNENGILTKDIDFPKYAKVYWDNGNIKKIGTGHLYRDNKGNFAVDSGHAETYFENGKINQQNDWKDKQGIAQKAWNENGVLVKEWSIPNYYKEYWDNGKPMYILTGVLYRDDKGNLAVDSGHSEDYFENGKISQQNDWKDKQGIAQKAWNENGVLVKEWSIPNYYKEYWDNGKPMNILTGALYRDDQGVICVDSGHSEVYFENGKISQQNNWKNKQPIASKQWNENGILTVDFVFPKYYELYWDNGNIKEIATGLLYRDDKGNFEVDSGHSEVYFENGKIKEQNDWKDKQAIASKGWNENGNLEYELKFPEYQKLYSDNGNIYLEKNGTLYYDDQNEIQIQDGYWKAHYENGQTEIHINYKDRKEIAKKIWREKGELEYEFVFPKYEKFYSDNGDIYIEKNGTLYYDDQNEIQIQDGCWKAYYENRQMSLHENYKEKKLISRKVWYENGTLKVEGDVSRGFYKKYFTNGKLSMEVSGKFYFDDDGEVILENASEKDWYENGVIGFEIHFPKSRKVYFPDGTLLGEETGTLYYDEQKEIQIQDGTRKTYYHDNGKIAQKLIYKGKRLVGKSVWNKNGIVTISVKLPNRYREFYDDGKLKVEVTGTIVEDDGSFNIKDGTYKEYTPNGESTYSATYKDFQRISEGI